MRKDDTTHWESREAAFEREAKRLGFIAVGFAPAEEPLFLSTFQEWLEAGKHGDMTWLSRHGALRAHPSAILKGCQTVVSMAYPYPAAKPATPDGLEAARYTQPRTVDYHQRLKQVTRPLLALLRIWEPQSRNRICLDSAPLLERSYALRAGVGFIGKNNLLIVPGHGSYVYLLEILTTIPFETPPRCNPENLCGDCDLCTRACPSGALGSPFQLDARRCLSYQSVEKRNPVDPETAAAMGSCFFGCDACQEACPYNPQDRLKDVCLPPATEILAMDSAAFAAAFGQSSFARAGLEKLKTNLRAVMGA